MQTELLHPRCPSRPAHRGRVAFRCEQLESRVVPSASPFAAVMAAPASAAYDEAASTTGAGRAPASHDAAFPASAAALDAVFGAGGAAGDIANGLSDAAYALALQHHAGAVLQDFAAPAAAHPTAHPSRTTLTVSAHTLTAGQKDTLTATVAVSGISTKPGGTVTFKDGSRTLGSAALVNGVASFTWDNPAAGTHSLTAVYGGGGAVQASTSAAASVTVAPNKTTARLTTPSFSNAHPTAGTPVTISVAFTLPAGTKATPGGTVTFKDGSTVLGTVTLNARGRASITLSNLAAGTHSIVAVYGGDAHFNAVTSSASLTVAKPAPVKASVQLSKPSVSTSRPTAGRPLTVAVSLSHTAGKTPTGSVTFKDGSTVLGTVPVNGHGATALTIPNLAVGTHSITATYSGDANFKGAGSGMTAVTVGSTTTGKAAVRVSVTDVGDVTGADRSLMFLVAVKAASGAGSPSGLITIKDGATVLGQVELDARGETAFARGIGLPAGRHTITAIYEGSDRFAAGSGSVTLTLS